MTNLYPPGPGSARTSWLQYALLIVPLVLLVGIGAVVLIHRSGHGSSGDADARPVGQLSAPPSPPRIPARKMMVIANRSLKRTKWGRSEFRFVGSNGNVETEDIRGGPHVQSEVDVFNGHAQRVVTIRKVAYVIGDAGYLQGLDNFSAAEAQRDAGKWVRLVPGDRPYGKVTHSGGGGGSALPIHGPYSVVGTVDRDGQQTIKVRGLHGKDTHARRAVIYLQDTSSYLPVELDEVQAVKNVTVAVTVHLLDFGKRVKISAPSQYVSWRALSGGSV